MTIEVKVPVLPESVADALMLEWSKEVGDQVSRDEILVEVETDKVVLEVPAPADGVLTEILEPEGATVLAEQVLARIEPGEATKSSAQESAESEPDPQPAEAAEAAESSDGDERLSPAVRRLVAETGIDPAAVDGSGRDGRITKEDVLNKLEQAASPEIDSPAPPAEPVQVKPAAAEAGSGGDRLESREPMSRLRQPIASRLVQAQQTAAMLTTFNEVNMQPVMELPGIPWHDDLS